MISEWPGPLFHITFSLNEEIATKSGDSLVNHSLLYTEVTKITLSSEPMLIAALSWSAPATMHKFNGSFSTYIKAVNEDEI